MLSIKQLYSYLKSCLNKTKHTEEINNNTNNNICAIEIALNNNFELDISIEFSEINIRSNKEFETYTTKIADFLNTINTQYVTYTIANLIIKDIGTDPTYKNFTDQIIKKWTILEKEKEYQKYSEEFAMPIVKPTQAFAKYFYHPNK